MTNESPSEAAPIGDGAPSAEGAPDPLMALVRDAAAGRRDRLAQLLGLVAPPVTATVRVLLGAGHPDLEDAVQESLIAIVGSLPRFRGDSTFLHYCRRIAVRTALALRRARDERVRKQAEASVEPEAAPANDPIGGEVEGGERLAIFRRLLDELPEGQAESLAYRVLLEAPLPVIARETGVPLNTVRSRIRLAREHLRNRITADPALADLLKEAR
jgi:RNA polymerase sigma-70 factor (ECF subfamily)